MESVAIASTKRLTNPATDYGFGATIGHWRRGTQLGSKRLLRLMPSFKTIVESMQECRMYVSSLESFCAEISRDIERAYAAGPNRLGWRFLASPAETLDGANVAFISLNPGGSHDPRDHPRLCVPRGSAYRDERWDDFGPGQAPLQRQVLALFELLVEKPEAVLAGHLVPFRSPSWSALADKKKSLELGRQLWMRILERAKPRMIVGMGGPVFEALSQIVAAGSPERIPVGWGSVRGARARFDGGTLVGLPHLSRFRIVTRSGSSEPLRRLLTQSG